MVLDSEEVTYTLRSDLPLAEMPDTVSQVVLTENSRLQPPPAPPDDADQPHHPRAGDDGPPAGFRLIRSRTGRTSQDRIQGRAYSGKVSSTGTTRG